MPSGLPVSQQRVGDRALHKAFERVAPRRVQSRAKGVVRALERAALPDGRFLVADTGLSPLPPALVAAGVTSLGRVPLWYTTIAPVLGDTRGASAGLMWGAAESDRFDVELPLHAMPLGPAVSLLASRLLGPEVEASGAPLMSASIQQLSGPHAERLARQLGSSVGREHPPLAAAGVAIDPPQGRAASNAVPLTQREPPGDWLTRELRESLQPRRTPLVLQGEGLNDYLQGLLELAVRASTPVRQAYLDSGDLEAVDVRPGSDLLEEVTHWTGSRAARVAQDALSAMQKLAQDPLRAGHLQPAPLGRPPFAERWDLPPQSRAVASLLDRARAASTESWARSPDPRGGDRFSKDELRELIGHDLRVLEAIRADGDPRGAAASPRRTT